MGDPIEVLIPPEMEDGDEPELNITLEEPYTIEEFPVPEAAGPTVDVALENVYGAEVAMEDNETPPDKLELIGSDPVPLAYPEDAFMVG